MSVYRVGLPRTPRGCGSLLLAVVAVGFVSVALPDAFAFDLVSVGAFWGLTLFGLVALLRLALRGRARSLPRDWRFYLVAVPLLAVLLLPVLFARLYGAMPEVAVLFGIYLFLGLGLMIVVGGVVFAFILARGYHPANRLVEQAAQHERGQGRVSAPEVAGVLAMPSVRRLGAWELEPGLPLAYVRTLAPPTVDTPIGLSPDSDTGHVAVIAPTRSGKSFHLTDSLMRWPGSAVVIDPKGEQWERTAGFREKHMGPVYRLPPQGVDLADLYDLDSDLELRSLFEALMRPWQDKQNRIFSDKCFPLFEAAVATGRARGEHPLRVLGRWARRSPVVALQEAEPYARDAVLTFTDGMEPKEVVNNRFAISAWGTFTVRCSPFAAHVETLAAGDIPADWPERNATVYITYPVQQQGAVGPLAAALVGGLMRRLQARRPARRALFAVDEMPTVGLPHLAASLATVGGAGVTMLLYAQSVPQIADVYGRDEANSILSNCTHQVYYPPRDPETADLVSKAFGTRLEVAEQRSLNTHGTIPMNQSSYSTRYQPALDVAEVLSLPAGAVVVFSGGMRFVAGSGMSRLVGELPELPAPPTMPEAGVRAVPAPMVRARVGTRDDTQLDVSRAQPGERDIQQEPYW